MICPKRLAELVNLNLGGLKQKEPAWEIGVSKIAGRGVFATRNIKCGEVIFKDDPLLIGPTLRNECPLNTCSICYSLMDPKKFLCKQGCGLPLCDNCSRRKQHKAECQLFKSWEPIEPQTPNILVIRLLVVARAMLFNANQKALLYAMQANIDTTFRNEVKNASACFKNFPTDKKTVEYLHRTVAILNTNSYEVNSSKQSDFPLRALFPLGGIVNHECVPNTTYTFDEKNYTIILKAAKDIKEGQEISISYTKLLWSNLMRQLFLKMTKQFSCKCQRCSDPTEGGALLSGLYCKSDDCHGLVVPETTLTLQPQWVCLECKKKYPHAVMSKTQDFALGAINAKLNGNSVKAIIDFINEKCPTFVPESNHIVVEAKYNVISRLMKSKEDFKFEDYESKKRYCQELLTILDKLGVGVNAMRTYLEQEQLR